MVSNDEGARFGALMQALPKPVPACCHTGMRSVTMWARSEAKTRPMPQIIETAKTAGFDLKALVRRIANGGNTPLEVAEAEAEAEHDIVIIDAGAGAGAADIFEPGTAARTMASLMPRTVPWLKAAVAACAVSTARVWAMGWNRAGVKIVGVVPPGLRLISVVGFVESVPLGQTQATLSTTFSVAVLSRVDLSNVERHALRVSPQLLNLRADESRYVATARALERHVNNAVAAQPALKHVVPQCSAINSIDASALESLEAIN